MDTHVLFRLEAKMKGGDINMSEKPADVSETHVEG